MGGLAIVLDTNAFFGDVHATKSWLSAVLDGAAHGDFEVVVPETVVMELIRQYPERLGEAIEKSNAAIGRTRKDLVRLGIEPPSLVEPDVDALIAAYGAELRARLTGPGCRIAEHPSDLSLAIAWAVGDRKPFKRERNDADANSFADAVIWLTVLREASDYDDVILVSTNVTDYGEPGDPPRLADEMVRDLEARGIPGDRVRLVTSVKTLAEQVVAPLAQVDSRAERLVADTRLRTALEDALAYSEIPQVGLRLGVDLDNDPQPLSIGINAIELVSARDAGGDRLLLELRVRAEMLLYMYVFRADYYADEWRSIVTITEPDWNEHYVEAEADVTAWLTLEVDTDLDASEVGVDVTAAERLSDEEALALRLERGAAASLIERLRGRTLPVDIYRPPEPVEGHIQQATLESIDAPRVVLDTIGHVDESGVTATVRVECEGDVNWVVTAPSGLDLRRYASSVEGDPAGGGFIQEISTGEPLVIFVSATLTPAGEWSEIAVQEVALAMDELERRMQAEESET